MRKIQVILLSMTMAVLSACADYLDIVPDDIATIEKSFNNRAAAERFFFTCYSTSTCCSSSFFSVLIFFSSCSTSK